MALTNPWDKTKIGLMFEGEENVKGEKKRRGRGRRRDQAKVWNFGFLYGN